MSAADDLNLAEPAYSAAVELEELFPGVIFTDGRRRKADQADRMAKNVCADQWIANTYTPSAASKACQAAVTQFLSAQLPALREVLFGVLAKFSDDELEHLSLHLAGLAFDVADVEPERQPALEAAIQHVVDKYGGKFLKNEGGKRILHAQFRRQ